MRERGRSSRAQSQGRRLCEQSSPAHRHGSALCTERHSHPGLECAFGRQKKSLRIHAGRHLSPWPTGVRASQTPLARSLALPCLALPPRRCSVEGEKKEADSRDDASEGQFFSVCCAASIRNAHAALGSMRPSARWSVCCLPPTSQRALQAATRAVALLRIQLPEPAAIPPKIDAGLLLLDSYRV